MDLDNSAKSKKRLVIPESLDEGVKLIILYNIINHLPQCLNWRYNFQYDMYSSQDWATVLSHAQRQATAEVNKISRDEHVVRKTGGVAPGGGDAPEFVHSCKFDQERMAELERQVEELTTGFNTLTQALSDMNEELSKAQGMLKFCYAICQNPAVKDLADSQRSSARASLGSLAFGKGGGPNRFGGPPNGSGRGAAWRPSP